MIHLTGPVRPPAAPKLALFAAAFLVVAAACSSVAATAAPVASQTVAAATATPSAAVTPAPIATAQASATAEASPTPTPAPTATPAPVVTPLPPLAVGLCKGSQLKLTISAWFPDGGSGVYAHVTAKNKSATACNMRGSSEARIADSHGTIIGDAGAAAAKVTSGDPIYPLAPGGEIYTIIKWFNWCKADPSQKVFVAMVQPYGLGAMIAAPLGNAPIPECWITGGRTQVSSENWLP